MYDPVLMADPPPIRRSASSSKPPIPRLPPVAPAAAKTETQGMPSEVPTEPGPNATPELVARVLDVVAMEATTLLGTTADARLADLNVRTALASWDVLKRPDEAARLLELAEDHPLAARLHVAAAIATGDVGALARRPEVERGEPALAIDVAEAWLWRHGMPDRAAAIADRVLQRADLPAIARRVASELAVVAYAAGGAWDRVVALRETAAPADAPPHQVASTAAMLLDRAGDAAAALDACFAALARGTDGDQLAWLHVLDVAIDAATRLADRRRLELLVRRDELVGALPGGALEALATRHAIAAEHARRGEHAEAAALLVKLADDPANQLGRAPARIALVQAAWSAHAAGQPATALAMHRRLADAECREVAATHAWRAFELAIASGEPARDLATALVDVVGAPVADTWLDVAEVASPTSGAITSFEARGGVGLRWAALVAERLGQPARARALWRRAAADVPIGTERDHVARLLRGEDDPALAELYGQWANGERDPRAQAALLCARGIVELARGALVEAEQPLHQAAALDDKDPFSRAALAAMFRARKQAQPLSNALAELAAVLGSRDARAEAMREHAELLDQLGDPTAARAALERMVAERPDDDGVLVALARIHDHDKAWDRAIELRLRAVAVAPTPRRRAEIWLDIAKAQEARGDRDAALSALDRAAELFPSEATGREQMRLYRAAGKLDRAVAVIRAELAGSPPPATARRMELQRELAQALTEIGREPEAVVAAYLDILSHEPDQTEALAGIEAPARMLGLWDELARAFRGAKQPTPRHLDVLAEALEHVAEWSELAEVRRRQLDAAASPTERARRAADLARLYTKELGDTDAAIRMLALAQANDFDVARQRELLRLLREAQRWPELANVLEKELPLATANVDREVDILIELGELRAGKLARPTEAIAAYEGVLARDSDNPLASAALEKLYELLGREHELANILEVRAEATQEPAARAATFARVAQIRTNRGETDGAISAYHRAFEADPTTRDAYTAMERFCYTPEGWAEAMHVSAIATAHVESGKSRAYRLGDLYSRRANVQLNFLADTDAAVGSYVKVIEVDSQPANAVKSLEDLCAARNDWQPLIGAWEKRAETQRDPQRRADALRAAGVIAAEHGVGDKRVSVRLNRKLLALDPSDTGAAEELERHYTQTGDHPALIDVLKQRLIAAVTPDDTVEILKKIARASEEGGRDVATATEHYRKILEIQKDNRDALDALARIYESTEQWAEFIEVTRELIKVTTDRNTRALLFFRCGSVMEAKFGREPDAIRYYHHAIKTSQSCLPAVHGLRDLYRRREEWERVIETLELEVKLWQVDKERAGVFAQIGRIYDKQLNDADRALEYYDSALTVDPDCLPANQAMFEHYFAQQAWDKALPLAQALAQKAMRDGDPSTRSDFFRKRGVVARLCGEPKIAAESLLIALEIKPTHTEALDELGRLARAQPDAWEFDATYRDLEKIYKKRDDAAPLLARVHVARAALILRDGDLDQALEQHRAALELAPADLTVLLSLVEFYCDTRQWAAAIDELERYVANPHTEPADRVAARMRQATIHADGEMDAPRAIAVLADVIRLDPAHQDAHYLLAQESFLGGKHAEARAAIDRVIELATAPGQPLSPEALARYYYYNGRIVDQSGDARGAAPQYRRAIDYDPGYAPPALVLARRYADGGDQRQAETLLIDAAHAAMAQGGPAAAVPLQRGLARILLAAGDRIAAIEAYRGVLNVEANADDRVALAEIYAVDDKPRAIAELRKVLERDIHHAPAYRMLAALYADAGNLDRANRVLTALDLLGFAEEADRQTLQRVRAARTSSPLRRALDLDSRARLLVTPAAHDPIGEVFGALAEAISETIVQPGFGEGLQPLGAADPRIAQLAGEISALFQLELREPQTADIVLVGDRVPGLAAVTAYPRQLVVIDRTLLVEPEPALRFLFGFAFEAIRGGYATLLQLGARQRRELVQLLRALLGPEDERTGPAAELVEHADPRAKKIVERLDGQRDVDPAGWIDGMLACAKRAGLVASDDFAAAVWMVARLTGERLASHDATVALGSVLGGPDLVRYYLSDSYQALRDVLAS